MSKIIVWGKKKIATIKHANVFWSKVLWIPNEMQAKIKAHFPIGPNQLVRVYE